MEFKGDNFEIYQSDCNEYMAGRDENSVDMVLTDPPYFFLGMNDEWNAKELETSSKVWAEAHPDRLRQYGNRFLNQALGYMKGGDTYGAKKTMEFYHFMKRVSDNAYKILKPGSFYFAFSQPRMVHRMMSAMEDAGFIIRDLMIWYHPKDSPLRAISVQYYVDERHGDVAEQERLKNSMENRKSPVPAVLYEPIVFAQKPCDGTLADNWQKWGVGLMNMSRESGGNLPGNVLYFNKPSGVKRKQSWNTHPTVKPTDLLEYIIHVYSKKGDIIYDPFLGSGSTVVAALNQGRFGLGTEMNEEYLKIAKRRIDEECGQVRLF